MPQDDRTGPTDPDVTRKEVEAIEKGVTSEPEKASQSRFPSLEAKVNKFKENAASITNIKNFIEKGPQLNYEMRGPDAANVRKQINAQKAENRYHKSNEARAKPHVVAAKSKELASSRDVEVGTKGILQKEFDNAKDKSR